MTTLKQWPPIKTTLKQWVSPPTFAERQCKQRLQFGIPWRLCSSSEPSRLLCCDLGSAQKTELRRTHVLFAVLVANVPQAQRRLPIPCWKKVAPPEGGGSNKEMFLFGSYKTIIIYVTNYEFKILSYLCYLQTISRYFAVQLKYRWNFLYQRSF